MRGKSILILLSASLLLAASASAQMRLPGISHLPQLPQSLGSTVDRTTADAFDDVRALSGARTLQIRALLHAHRREVDTDPAGAPVVRDEIVVIDPSPAVLQALQQAGFTIAGDNLLDGLSLRVLSLHAPAGVGTRAAVLLAHRIDPSGQYDFDHLFWRSGQTASASTSPSPPAPAGHFSVGLIDGGVDATHPALAHTDVHRWGCHGQPVLDVHGTEVASLLAGSAVADPRGDITLYAADVYCNQPTGGNAVAVAQALAWMARERVGVINISLVGPANALLGRAVAAAQARGHLIVSAVGNDGPAAPALYPASYPGVVGVSAVNARKRVLPEAGRGPQVDFVAPGADMVAAAPAGHWNQVRGTSFAAPLVARLAATRMSTPDVSVAATTLARLTEQAVLPAGARSDVYGHGLLAGTLPLSRPPVAN